MVAAALLLAVLAWPARAALIGVAWRGGRDSIARHAPPALALPPKLQDELAPFLMKACDMIMHTLHSHCPHRKWPQHTSGPCTSGLATNLPSPQTCPRHKNLPSPQKLALATKTCPRHTNLPSPQTCPRHTNLPSPQTCPRHKHALVSHPLALPHPQRVSHTHIPFTGPPPHTHLCPYPYPHPTHTPPTPHPHPTPLYPHSTPLYPHPTPLYPHSTPLYPHPTPLYPHPHPHPHPILTCLSR